MKYRGKSSLGETFFRNVARAAIRRVNNSLPRRIFVWNKIAKRERDREREREREREGDQTTRQSRQNSFPNGGQKILKITRKSAKSAKKSHAGEKKQKVLFFKESEDEREEEQHKRTRKMVRAPRIKRSSKHSRY